MAYYQALYILVGAVSRQQDHGRKGPSPPEADSKPSANRAAAALRLAANSLYRSKSALGAFLRRKKAQLGAPQAITATAHKLARLIYSMLKYGQGYVDAGQDYYESQYRERALRNLTRRATELGYNLVATQQPTPTAPCP